MKAHRLLGALACLLGLCAAALGQFGEAVPQARGLGPASVGRWRIGVIVTAGGACRGVVATTSVPTDWPEQAVRAVDEEVSPGVRVSYATIDDVARRAAVRQMTVRIASLTPGQTAGGVVTFEVKRRERRPPDDAEAYTLPNPRRIRRKLPGYLRPSPYIESDDPQVAALAAELGADRSTAWGRVEAIHDWVRERIELEDNQGRGVKSTRETLRDGTGDCDELTSLFIAICRAGGVPARTVRVPGHCYPEFYLEDAAGEGHWFACDATRPAPFGEVADDRPVLQKGDHLRLRDPNTRRTRAYRFLPDNVLVADLSGAPPEVRVVLERTDDRP